MSNTWINHADGLWLALVAALTLSLARACLKRIRHSLARVNWSRVITVELRVTVRAPRRVRRGC